MIELILILVFFAVLCVAFRPRKKRWVFDGRQWTLKAFVLLMPLSAEAQSIRVHVDHFYHSRGLSRAQARAVWEAAKGQIAEETGIELRLASWSSKQDRPFAPKDTWPSVRFMGPHAVAVNHYEARIPYRYTPNSISLLIAPRYRVGGRWWNAGQASLCGGRALAIVGNLRRFRDRSLSPAATVVTHELGHALGADHDDSACQIMHPAAGGELERCGWRLSFSEKSLGEIGMCRGER